MNIAWEALSQKINFYNEIKLLRNLSWPRKETRFVARFEIVGCPDFYATKRVTYILDGIVRDNSNTKDRDNCSINLYSDFYVQFYNTFMILISRVSRLLSRVFIIYSRHVAAPTLITTYDTH